MMKMIFMALLAALPLRAGALELLLDDNRGDAGTIGYVDIDRVFKEYSGTSGAREEFIAEIKKKEGEVAALKTGVFTMKAEIAKLRQEREFAVTLPALFDARKSVEDAAALKAAQPDAAPATGTEVSTAAADGQVPPPPAPPPAVPAAAPQAGTINMPGIGNVPLSRFKFSVSTSVPEIDAAIEKKTAELARSEDNLRAFQKQAERELLEYESHRTEILLGRIYVALKELAVKEAVSVVVDKRNILFGQPAVDLTGKLLERLEAEGL
ncbi:MAG TPA: OmpH family outer membrane protein [Elusimicrobiales bacterium]|nr:OmpH family outer membrane protein [Elusimicrobiales bacterium]